jgi:hypothetical protein
MTRDRGKTKDVTKLHNERKTREKPPEDSTKNMICTSASEFVVDSRHFPMAPLLTFTLGPAQIFTQAAPACSAVPACTTLRVFLALLP